MSPLIDTIIKSAPEPPQNRTLTLIDRCDRCSAQALVLVANNTAELLFCGHHHRKFGDALSQQGWEVTIDITETIR